MEDALTDGLGNNLGESEPTTQSEIMSMRKMMEEQQEMLNNTLQQNTHPCVQNAELMEANWEYCGESIPPEANKMKIFNMTHPEHYCGGVKALDNFLDTLQSNYQSHAH
jgi:predicted metal-dependent hydrolase